jgi:hypothetical protein
MDFHIQVNICFTNKLHFGLESNYDKLNGCYFEQIDSLQENIIDNGIVNYYFRNFSHLVKMYEEKGYKFIKSS